MNHHVLLIRCALSFLVAGCGRAGDTEALPPHNSSSNHSLNVIHVSREAETELVVEPVQNRPVTQEIIVQGRVQYGLDGFVKLSSPLPGVVKTVRARLGEHVHADQPLITIQSADIGTAYSDFTKAEADWQLAQRSFQL